MSGIKSAADQIITIDFQPLGRRIQIPSGTTILAAAQQAGVELVSLCGGIGSCDSCQVRIFKGQVSPVTSQERQALGEAMLSDGLRLACQTNAFSDLKVEIPQTSLATPQRLQVEGQAFHETPDPTIIPVELQLDPPSLYDQKADDTRLNEALAELGLDDLHVSPALWPTLSEQLRSQSWAARLALREHEIVAVFPPATPLLGVAFDVGTTKLAGYLVELASGVTLAKTGAMNPQVAFGEDVVSRIAFTDHDPNGRRTLQSKLIESLNAMTAELCEQANAAPGQVVDAVIVGNTVMHHLCAGLPVRQLGVSPYVPAVAGAMSLQAQDLGLKLAPGAAVHLPPNIAGYIGADHVAMMLACGIHDATQATIALDIGTNTEITLAVEGRLLCCSCASGPAFEGAHIRDGMRAAPGAIERVQIEGDDVRTYTIGAVPPVGICGSGILDTVAGLVQNKLLDSRGGLVEGHPHIRPADGRREFVVVPAAKTGHNRDILLTRADINEIQLAKGAIRAGIQVLLAEGGIEEGAVQEFIVAGAFGTYLNVESAMRVGMFPDLPQARFHQVGNAAGMGALRMLISKSQRSVAAQIVEHVQYIELTTHPGFRDAFMNALFF